MILVASQSIYTLFSPAEFETAVRSALQISDGYVWIYTDRPKWWTNEMLPQDYVKAVAKARKAVP